MKAPSLVGGRIVLHYLVDVQSRLRVFSLDGSAEGEIALPGVGAVAELSGGRDDTPTSGSRSARRSSPATVYRYDLDGERSTSRSSRRQPPIDAAQFETRALFATSKDGTRVPFFLTREEGTCHSTARNPTMLYGYGGFSISVLPSYRSDVPAWLELGGVFVTRQHARRRRVRRGLAQGRSCSRRSRTSSTTSSPSPSTWCSEKYTSPAHLGMMGGSNGGLLVGAVMEQRPDLFAVALPAVGVMDMLRYDRVHGRHALGDRVRLVVRSARSSRS